MSSKTQGRRPFDHPGRDLDRVDSREEPLQYGPPQPEPSYRNGRPSLPAERESDPPTATSTATSGGQEKISTNQSSGPPVQHNVEKLRQLKKDIMDNQIPYYDSRPKPEALQAIYIPPNKNSLDGPRLRDDNYTSNPRQDLYPRYQNSNGAGSPTSARFNRDPQDRSSNYNGYPPTSGGGREVDQYDHYASMSKYDPMSSSHAAMASETHNLPPRLQRASRYMMHNTTSPASSTDAFPRPPSPLPRRQSFASDKMDVDSPVLAQSPAHERGPSRSGSGRELAPASPMDYHSRSGPLSDREPSRSHGYATPSGDDRRLGRDPHVHRRSDAMPPFGDTRSPVDHRPNSPRRGGVPPLDSRGPAPPRDYRDRRDSKGSYTDDRRYQEPKHTSQMSPIDDRQTMYPRGDQVLPGVRPPDRGSHSAGATRYDERDRRPADDYYQRTSQPPSDHSFRGRSPPRGPIETGKPLDPPRAFDNRYSGPRHSEPETQLPYGAPDGEPQDSGPSSTSNEPNVTEPGSADLAQRPASPAQETSHRSPSQASQVKQEASALPTDTTAQPEAVLELDADDQQKQDIVSDPVINPKVEREESVDTTKSSSDSPRKPTRFGSPIKVAEPSGPPPVPSYGLMRPLDDTSAASPNGVSAVDPSSPSDQAKPGHDSGKPPTDAKSLAGSDSDPLAVHRARAAEARSRNPPPIPPPSHPPQPFGQTRSVSLSRSDRDSSSVGRGYPPEDLPRGSAGSALLSRFSHAPPPLQESERRRPPPPPDPYGPRPPPQAAYGRRDYDLDRAGYGPPPRGRDDLPPPRESYPQDRAAWAGRSPMDIENRRSSAQGPPGEYPRIPRDEWDRERLPPGGASRYPPPPPPRPGSPPYGYGRPRSPSPNRYGRPGYPPLDERGALKRPREDSMDIDIRRGPPPPSWHDRDVYDSRRPPPPRPDDPYYRPEPIRYDSRADYERYGRGGPPPPGPAPYAGDRYPGAPPAAWGREPDYRR